MADENKKQSKSTSTAAASATPKKDPTPTKVEEGNTEKDQQELDKVTQEAQKILDDARKKKERADKVIAIKKDELLKEREKQEKELAQKNAELMASMLAVESDKEKMERALEEQRELVDSLAEMKMKAEEEALESKRRMDMEREALEEEKRIINEEKARIQREQDEAARAKSSDISRYKSWTGYSNNDDDNDNENGTGAGSVGQSESESEDDENDIGLGRNSRTSSISSKAVNNKSTGDSVTGYDTVMQKLYEEITKYDSEARNLMMDKWLTLPVFQPDGKTSTGFDSVEFSYIIAYQGFKPFEMACLIIKRMNKSGGNTHDLHRMVQIGSERGNNLEKLTKGASRSFLDILKRLKTTYCLKSKAGKNPHAITLSRVCMSFPHVSCSYARINRNPIVHGSALDDNNYVYPRPMMTAAFGSIIPNSQDEPYKKIINAFYVYQYEFGIVVSPDKNRIKSAKASLPDLSKYLNAAITGSVMTMTTRISLLLEWDILLKLEDGTYDSSPTIDYYNDLWITKYLKK